MAELHCPSAGPIPPEDAAARLEAYEGLTRQLQQEYRELALQLEALRAQGKTHSARFRELLGKKLMLADHLARLKAWGLM